MEMIARRQKPAKRSVRRITHWTEQHNQLFLAYAEYLQESDDLDYVLMAMVDSITDEDEQFRRLATRDVVESSAESEGDVGADAAVHDGAVTGELRPVAALRDAVAEEDDAAGHHRF